MWMKKASNIVIIRCASCFNTQRACDRPMVVVINYSNIHPDSLRLSRLHQRSQVLRPPALHCISFSSSSPCRQNELHGTSSSTPRQPQARSHRVGHWVKGHLAGRLIIMIITTGTTAQRHNNLAPLNAAVTGEARTPRRPVDILPLMMMTSTEDIESSGGSVQGGGGSNNNTNKLFISRNWAAPLFDTIDR